MANIHLERDTFNDFYRFSIARQPSHLLRLQEFEGEQYDVTRRFSAFK